MPDRCKINRRETVFFSIDLAPPALSKEFSQEIILKKRFPMENVRDDKRKVSKNLVESDISLRYPPVILPLLFFRRLPRVVKITWLVPVICAAKSFNRSYLITAMHRFADTLYRINPTYTFYLPISLLLSRITFAILVSLSLFSFPSSLFIILNNSKKENDDRNLESISKITNHEYVNIFLPFCLVLDSNIYLLLFRPRNRSSTNIFRDYKMIFHSFLSLRSVNNIDVET